MRSICANIRMQWGKFYWPISREFYSFILIFYSNENVQIIHIPIFVWISVSAPHANSKTTSKRIYSEARNIPLQYLWCALNFSIFHLNSWCKFSHSWRRYFGLEAGSCVLDVGIREILTMVILQQQLHCEFIPSSGHKSHDVFMLFFLVQVEMCEDTWIVIKLILVALLGGSMIVNLFHVLHSWRNTLISFRQKFKFLKSPYMQNYVWYVNMNVIKYASAYFADHND